MHCSIESLKKHTLKMSKKGVFLRNAKKIKIFFVFIPGYLGVFPNENVSFLLEVIKNPNTEVFNFGTFMGKKPLITECDFSLLKLMEHTSGHGGLVGL